MRTRAYVVSPESPGPYSTPQRIAVDASDAFAALRAADPFLIGRADVLVVGTGEMLLAYRPSTRNKWELTSKSETWREA